MIMQFLEKFSLEDRGSQRYTNEFFFIWVMRLCKLYRLRESREACSLHSFSFFFNDGKYKESALNSSRVIYNFLLKAAREL